MCNEISDRDAPNIRKYNSSRSGPGAPVRHLLQLEIRISWDFDGLLKIPVVNKACSTVQFPM